MAQSRAPWPGDGEGTRSGLERFQDAGRRVTVTLVGIIGAPTEWHAIADVIRVNRYYGWYIQGGQLELALASLERELDALCATASR